MDILGTTKLVSGLVVSGSVGMIVGNVVKSTMPVAPKLLQRVGYQVGAFVIGGMTADFAVRYMEKEIDDSVDVAKRMTDAVRNLRKTKVVIVHEDQPEGSTESDEKTDTEE